MTTIVGNDDIFGSMIQVKPYVFNSCFLQSLLHPIFFETYGGQKISSITVIPLTCAVKKPLGTNNLTSHVDMCQSNCVCSYG
jgi:hypothetical protein